MQCITTREVDLAEKQVCREATTDPVTTSKHERVLGDGYLCPLLFIHFLDGVLCQSLYNYRCMNKQSLTHRKTEGQSTAFSPLPFIKHVFCYHSLQLHTWSQVYKWGVRYLSKGSLLIATLPRKETPSLWIKSHCLLSPSHICDKLLMAKYPSWMLSMWIKGLFCINFSIFAI